MTMVRIGIIAGGVLSLLLAAFHCRFHRQFGWKDDFARIAPLNHRILYTIHVALILLFLCFGLLSLTYSMELSQGQGLACGVTVSYAIFWLWRAVWQVVYFRRSKCDYDGKLTVLHYLLIVVFAVLFVAYSGPTASRLLRYWTS